MKMKNFDLKKIRFFFISKNFKIFIEKCMKMKNFEIEKNFEIFIFHILLFMKKIEIFRKIFDLKIFQMKI